MTAEWIAGDSGATPTTLVKDELARRPLSTHCCLFAEIAVILRLAGTVQVDRGSTRLIAGLDHGGAAHRLAVMATTLTGQRPDIECGPGRGSAFRWTVRIEAGAAALARRVGLCDGTGRQINGIPQHVMVSAACCQVAAWRAAILAAGTLPVMAGERRLRVGCPDLPAAMSLAMLAGRISSRARVPTAGPPAVVVEAAGEVAAVLAAVGVSEALTAAVLLPVGRPRASTERLRAGQLRPTATVVAARCDVLLPESTDADRARR
jgi:DNA-binding protein WhiA